MLTSSNPTFYLNINLLHHKSMYKKPLSKLLKTRISIEIKRTKTWLRLNRSRKIFKTLQLLYFTIL